MCNIIQTTMLLLFVVGATLNNLSANSSSRNSFDGYIKTAEQFIAANPLEKVYLHLDNSSYFVGDTLWFKAYAVNAAQNRPTEESAILHVELLNPEGVIVRMQKYRLESGRCDGSIPLDKELLSGFFEIRAYTKAMFNFSDKNYFTRVFPIFEGTPQTPELLDRQRIVGYVSEKPSKKEIKQAEKEQKKASYYSVEFYPEGGNLVVGLASKVAFQVRDSEGELISAKCKVIDSDGNVISARSTHLGIGTFEITPNGKRYYMLVEGDKTRYELPLSLQAGSVISVESVATGVEIAIESNVLETMGVAILAQGEILFAKEFKGSDRFVVDPKSLKEGVNQVVVYEWQGGALASRMFFVRNGLQPQLTISPTKVGESRSHACQDITFKVTDSDGNGVATDFSLAIYDDTSAGTSQHSIYTSLLLSLS